MDPSAPQAVVGIAAQVVSVHLSRDTREVFLEIPGRIAVNQMRIEYDLQAADGTPIREDICDTVHELRSAFEP